MRTLIRLTAALAALAFSYVAAAGTIEITPGDCGASGTTYILGTSCWLGDENSQPKAPDLAALTGIAEDDLTELYKAEQGGSDGP